ncbi:MAG: (2Fe-2S)-binding domain protein [Betaproteobacteria bacterium]|nr:(2Fe-2S)-binding domain protein [Betaproteobacteria bacterium]
MSDENESRAARLSRRAFMQGAVAGAAATALPAAQAQQARPGAQAGAATADAAAAQVMLNINGRSQAMRIEPTVSLLDAIRDHAGLTGSKKGCDRGQCGACTVLVNGRRINSCLSLAVMHEGDEITTIEGLEHGGRLHEVQAAFVEYDAFQCGYCTPGQICSSVAMLAEAEAGTASAATSAADLRGVLAPALSDAEIRERMSGNICRCGAYPNIVAALRAVHGKSA